MNIHPMLVHFPIAFFTLYSFLELFRLPILTRQVYYFYVKGTLVIVGFLAALPTIGAGLIAKEIYRSPALDKIILVHETFAITTTCFMGVIAFLYCVGWLRRSGYSKFNSETISGFWQSAIKIEKILTERPIGIIVGMIGLCLILSVGALGGLLAYGPQNDPISGFVYSLIK